MEKILLSIFVPCHNEENNITNTLNNIKDGIQNISYEVLVSDDASKDKTINMVEKFKTENPNINVKVFTNEINKGIGFNYYATAHKAAGKYYMLINGDAVDPPEEIKKIVSNIGKSDMILTYIIDPRGIFRRTLSRLFVFIINLITFNNIKYYNGSNVHLLENVKLYSGGSSGFGYQAELITSQITQKKTYTEVEIEQYSSSATSESLTPGSVPSVITSIIIIFLRQLIYLVKKILNIK